jgi:hypothetical protein
VIGENATNYDNATTRHFFSGLSRRRGCRRVAFYAFDQEAFETIQTTGGRCDPAVTEA